MGTRPRTSLLAVIGILALGAALEAARLRPEAIAGWDRYVSGVDARRGAETHDARRFLVLDYTADAQRDRAAIRAGLIAVHDAGLDTWGDPVVTPAALVHHWRGAVLLPRVSLARVLASLETEAPWTGPDVLRSTVRSLGPGAMTLELRLQRTQLVTAVYDTEHDIRFTRESPTRASSVSTAVRIAEVAGAGTPEEHLLPPGEDRGFLWRLRVYWRYETVPEGVIAECESLSLSRDVPFGLQTIAGPLIRATARESVERTLSELRRRFSGG